MEDPKITHETNLLQEWHGEVVAPAVEQEPSPGEAGGIVDLCVGKGEKWMVK